MRHYRCYRLKFATRSCRGSRINTSSPTGFACGQCWLPLTLRQNKPPVLCGASTLVELACSMLGLLSSALFINARSAAETSKSRQAILSK